MKGSAHLFCSSAVPINVLTSDLSSRTNDINVQDRRFNAWGSGHSGVSGFAFCDGSATFIKEDISLLTLAKLSTRAGDEVIDHSEF